MKVLITRPREASQRLAARIAALGHDPVIAPMLEIVPQASALRLPNDIGALLFTSANGVQAFALSNPMRTTTVFAVGPATAAAARAAGFDSVVCSTGDGNDLAALVGRRHSAQSGRLVLLRGRDTASDVAETLRNSGYRVSERIVYAAEPILAIPVSALDAIRGREICAALFFSTRTAEAFASALPNEDRHYLCSARAIAIAPRVAMAIATIGFRSVEIAVEPREDAMICSLRYSCDEAGPART